MRTREHRGVFEKVKGSGVWWVEYQDDRGRRKRKKIGKKADAIKVAEQLRARVRLAKIAPELVAETQAPKSLAEILDHRLTVSTNKPRTKVEEARHAAQWKKWLPGVMVADVTPTRIKKWMAKRLETVKPATVNRSLAFLSIAFNEAIEAGWVTTNPVARVKSLRENNQRDDYLKQYQFAILQERLHPQALMLVELAILTGMRAGEQFWLTRDELRLDEGLIKLPDPKSGKKEWVSLNSRAVEILTTILDSHESHWVFPGQRDYRPMEYSHFFKTVVRPVLIEIGEGAENLTWHSFRHTCASWLAEEGVPLSVIQKVMRHSTIRMTERYAHLCKSQHHEAVEVLATATRTATVESRPLLKLVK